jgi:hypothetical protein
MPAPAWSAPAPVVEPPAPAGVETTDAVLSAGAADAAVVQPPPAVEEPVAPAPEPPAQPLPWEAPPVAAPSQTIPSIAATIVSDSGQRESTTLMPAWQPPPAAPPVGVPNAAVIGGPQKPEVHAVTGSGPQAELTIESGPDAGHSYRAGETALRLGRSPDNDLILRDPATSGHHARIELRAQHFWIVDLGSTNGTLVNGEPIQEKELSHGDRITIGQNAVHFSVLGA